MWNTRKVEENMGFNHVKIENAAKIIWKSKKSKRKSSKIGFALWKFCGESQFRGFAVQLDYGKEICRDTVSRMVLITKLNWKRHLILIDYLNIRCSKLSMVWLIRHFILSDVSSQSRGTGDPKVRYFLHQWSALFFLFLDHRMKLTEGALKIIDAPYAGTPNTRCA